MPSEKKGTTPTSHFQQLIEVAMNAKVSWDTVNLEEVTEIVKALTTECERRRDYYMKPGFTDMLNGLIPIINGMEQNYAKREQLDSCHRAIFSLLHTLMKEDLVRVALRDQHKLFSHLSVFFNPGLLPDDMLLLLRVLEASSRNIVISWKPPPLNLLLKKIYTYVQKNQEPSQQLSLAFQLLINICVANPSCASIGRVDENFKELLRTFKTSKNGLAVHLLMLHKPMLPVEILNTGYEYVIQTTAEAWLKKLQEEIPPQLTVPTFLQLRDIMDTITRKIEPLFTSDSLEPAEESLADTKLHKFTISESKETFLRLIADTLSQLKAFVLEDTKSSGSIKVEVLKFLLALLPPYVPVSLNLESIKEALSITDAFWKTAEKGSPVYLGCLSVYLRVVEQVLSSREGCKISFEKLVSEKYFGNVFAKLSLSADVHPSSVEMNISSIRLIAFLSDSVFAEEGSKKLDLSLLRSLVVALAEPTDLLPNIQWRRTVCLVELLATMSKYSTSTNILNQLLNFVSTPNVSKQIVISILNGDERTVRSGIAVTTATAFAEVALSSISKSVIKERDSVFTLDSRTSETRLITYTDAEMNLDSAMMRFTTLYDNSSPKAPNVDDLLSWHNLKLELHQHELSVANQNVALLQKTIDHLKSLMKKQSDLVSRQTVENDSQKSEQMLLLKASASQQKKFDAQLAGLEKEQEMLTSQIAAQKGRVEDLEKIVVTLKEEKEQLLQDLKREEQGRGEAVMKLKGAREEIKTLKTDNGRLEKELKETKGTVASLQVSLKEKTEEAERNKSLFDIEKRRVDAIRAVVGQRFDNLDLGEYPTK